MRGEIIPEDAEWAKMLNKMTIYKMSSREGNMVNWVNCRLLGASTTSIRLLEINKFSLIELEIAKTNLMQAATLLI